MRPDRDEALAGGTAQGSRGQTTESTDIVHATDAEGKSFLTLRARAARRGIALYRVSGGFLICWGSSYREITSLPEVEALLQRLEDAR